MNAELLRKRASAHAVGTGCLYSVHFLVGQLCSSASPWFCGGHDQWVIRLANKLGHAVRPLIPRGNKPLNPRSSVPVVVDEVPVERIASLVGFKSTTVLRDHFRREVGLSPQSFRKRFGCPEAEW